VITKSGELYTFGNGNWGVLGHGNEDKVAFNKPKLLVEFAVQRMIKFRFSNESSRNIPGIIMIGPPGSGRST
jgi:hypothetical protein